MAKNGPKGPTRYTDAYIDLLTDKLLEYIKRVQIPFLKEFAYENDMPAEEISRTCSKNDKFRRAMNILKDRQEMQIIKGGLAGKLNPAFSIFTLKNVAGWRDQPVEYTTDDRLEEELEFKGMPEGEVNGKYKRFYN